jgi:hypothetical protein
MQRFEASFALNGDIQYGALEVFDAYVLVLFFTFLLTIFEGILSCLAK